MNTFGTIYRFTTFGESHGPAIGGVIDGLPAGIDIDVDAVQECLDRRKPGQSKLTTSRREPDKVKFLSGIFEGKSTGTPIGFIIENTNQRSNDYSEIATKLRPNHADFTYQAKYGIRDYRGGGRSSARETACRVVAGALAMQVLNKLGIKVIAFTNRIGSVSLDSIPSDITLEQIEANAVRCSDTPTATAMQQEIEQAQRDGDTLGGIVTCIISGAEAGLGEPLYSKLSSMLGSAMLSINAAKGVEIGDGFALATKRGSEVIDPFESDAEGNIHTTVNHSGGIQGGISNSAPIIVNVAFKPVATMMRPIETVTTTGDKTVLEPHGRHDVCVVPRAVPVVEAMAACTILDAVMLNQSKHIIP